MPSIAVTELDSLLMGISRSTFVSFTALTQPDMKTRRNPYCTQDGRKWISNVRKVSILSGALINCSYTRVVDRRRISEGVETLRQQIGQRKPRPRAWGEHVDGGPLITHVTGGGSKLYLHVMVQRRSDHFFDERSAERIDAADLAEWLNPRDRGYDHQGLNNPVIVKDFELCNIAELTTNQTSYRIAPAVAELQRYLPRTEPTEPAARRRDATSSPPKRRPATKGARQ